MWRVIFTLLAHEIQCHTSATFQYGRLPYSSDITKSANAHKMTFEVDPTRRYIITRKRFFRICIILLEMNFMKEGYPILS